MSANEDSRESPYVDRLFACRAGSVEVQRPRRWWPDVGARFTRNGRMLGLALWIGDFYVSPAIYRPPWESTDA